MADPAPSQLLTLPQNTNVSDIFGQVVKGAGDYYNTLNSINQLKYGAQLVKAQGKTAVNVAKAGGQNAAITAGAGLPSPSLLLVGGLALAAIMILKR